MDTHTPVPGGVGTFQGFDVPTALGFLATFEGGSGIYGISTGQFGGPPYAPFKIADTSTPIPGGTGTFTSFDARASEIFRGTGANGQQGIYRPAVGKQPLSVIADRNTAAPGGGTFTTFGTGPTAMFYAETSTGVKGVYYSGSQITTVADTRHPTQVIGHVTPLTFSGFGGFFGAFTFFGTVDKKLGVYSYGVGSFPDELKTVLDDTTPVLKTGSIVDTFKGAVNAASVDGNVFITASFPGSNIETVMKVPSIGFGVEAVARTGDPTPGGRDTKFYSFLGVGQNLGSIEQGPLTFFSATNLDGTRGIYYQRKFSQSIEVLIDTTMTLDGKAISSLSMETRQRRGCTARRSEWTSKTARREFTPRARASPSPAHWRPAWWPSRPWPGAHAGPSRSTKR